MTGGGTIDQTLSSGMPDSGGFITANSQVKCIILQGVHTHVYSEEICCILVTVAQKVTGMTSMHGHVQATLLSCDTCDKWYSNLRILCQADHVSKTEICHASIPNPRQQFSIRSYPMSLMDKV